MHRRLSSRVMGLFPWGSGLAYTAAPWPKLSTRSLESGVHGTSKAPRPTSPAPPPLDLVRYLEGAVPMGLTAVPCLSFRAGLVLKASLACLGWSESR